MTGFKDGATDSPFDDEPDASDATTNEAQTDDHPDQESSGDPNSGDEKTDDATEAGALPWKYRRESSQAGRKQRQIHLQPDTIAQEREFQNTVADTLDEDVIKADLREAALLVAMDHVDEVADQLREWGYDHE